ncbi:MAG TPA: S8 family serine peptidase, partial [Opitutaceae bacterium]|nr:S8 family serine peptidase [Opitutaceae bacterium]
MRDSAPEVVPLRVVVKFRPGLDQGFASALKPDTNTVDLAMATGADPRVAALVSKHGIRAVKPAFGHHAHQRMMMGLSEAQIQQNTRQRFPLRAARASGPGVLPDLSASYILDLGPGPAGQREAALQSLRSEPDVVYAEEDRTVAVSFSPNDPDYVSGDLYGLNVLDCGTAWDSAQGSGVVVAVVDTGVDYNHPDIQDNIWTNPHPDENGYINDVKGWDFIGPTYTQPTQGNDPYDREGHGTHVAGTIAAVGNNGIGVIGVAWQAKIMIVKGLDDTGTGLDSTLAEAIVYAADEGADVINASWGEPGISQTLKDAVDYAHGMGVVIVVAAGNNDIDASGFCPANLPNVIAVAATDESNQKASFSNYGSKIDVAAPGVDILSLQAGTTNYISMSGTSMAAPHVSGVAALILSLHPAYTNEQVRQVLRTSADDLGTVGRDDIYGYGLVNAAQALQAAVPLEAKILSPMEATAINGAVALTGTAQGPGFASYTVDYGSGDLPASWTVIQSSTTSVSNGSIGSFNPSALPDGLYTVRLRAVNATGHVFSDQIQINVQYLAITSPLPPAAYSLTTEVKPGASLQITGTATGPSFKKYKLQWAPGVGATSGWSTSGITLPNGSAQVASGVLGTWAVPATASGDYTIQLVVTDSTFSSVLNTTVYCEPSLLSPGFPQFAGTVNYADSALPARLPNGTTRFIYCNGFSPSGTTCLSYATDGTFASVALDQGSDVQPAVGPLDGTAAGDEVVISDRFALKIFSANLALVRTITTGRQQIFGLHLTRLADLDNDGVPEILDVAQDSDPTGRWYASTGALYVYKSNGQLFSSNYPLTITSPLTPAGFSDVKYIAVDLNHDGRKEIVLAVLSLDATSYTLEAFNADGTPYQPWPTPSFPASWIFSMSAADLNHDGTSEIIITGVQSGQTQIRVVNGDGTVRPGWPVSLAGTEAYSTAVGDLNGDGLNEIVVGTNQGLYVLHQDGTMATGWPLLGTFREPVIADIDNDGKAEIIISHSTPVWTSVPYLDVRLTAYRGDGSILKDWRLFGSAGRQAFFGVPAVGDFNGDGKTDIAVQTSLIEGGGVSGDLQNGAFTVLTTGTTFNPSRADWVCNFRDPQES